MRVCVSYFVHRLFISLGKPLNEFEGTRVKTALVYLWFRFMVPRLSRINYEIHMQRGKERERERETAKNSEQNMYAKHQNRELGQIN